MQNIISGHHKRPTGYIKIQLHVVLFSPFSQIHYNTVRMKPNLIQ